MGTAITLGIAPDLSTAVTEYFKKFRVLPPKALAVTKTKVAGGPTSFENLLNVILAEKDTDYVIVVHGHEAGTGLFLKLATVAGTPAGSQTTHEMLEIFMNIDARKPRQIEPRDRDKTGLKDTDINRLVDLMNKVRAMKLKSVEFRGCNLGRDANSLDRFRRFLGSQTFGAPNLHSFFGTSPMKASEALMSSHTKSHVGTTFTYPSSFAGKTCLCCIGVNDQRKPINGHIVAPDDATLDAWIKANFDATAASGGAKSLPVHGLWEFPKAPANDPLPIDPEPRPLFPLAIASDGANKGKNEYTLHVIYKP